MKYHAHWIASIVLPFWAAFPLRAAEDPTTEAGVFAAFPKGTWDVEAKGSFAWEFYPDDHEKITTGAAGIGYYLADNSLQ